MHSLLFIGKFLHDRWNNINEELSRFTTFMNDDPPQAKSEEERYRVEFSYLYATLKMYHGLMSAAPLSTTALLFACLQDKYNLSEPVKPSGQLTLSSDIVTSNACYSTNLSLCFMCSDYHVKYQPALPHECDTPQKAQEFP